MKQVKFVYEIDWYDIDIDGLHTETHKFEGCCGAQIIVGFPESIKEVYSRIKEDFDDQWKAHIYEHGVSYKPSCPSRSFVTTEILKKISKDFPSTSSGTVYFIILNEEQKSFLGTFVKAKGLRLVSDRTVNSRTGNRLFVYIRDVLTPKKPNAKRRVFK